MDIHVILQQMMQLFIIIFIGYYLGKRHKINDNFVNVFTNVILDVTMPAMILSSVLNPSERLGYSSLFIVLLLALVLYSIILPLLSYSYIKIAKVSKDDQGIYMFATIFSNIGFMGFPVVEAIYGESSIVYVAIFNLIFNVILFTVGSSIINFSGDSLKGNIDLSCLKSPGVIASVLAIIIYMINIPFSPVIKSSLDTLGKITTPGAMVLIGVALSKIQVKALFNDIKLYIYSSIRQIAIPILLWFVLKNIIHDNFILGITLLMVSMPVGNIAVLLSNRYRKNEVLAAKMVFITTLMSIVTIPLVIYLCVNLLG